MPLHTTLKKMWGPPQTTVPLNEPMRSFEMAMHKLIHNIGESDSTRRYILQNALLLLTSMALGWGLGRAWLHALKTASLQTQRAPSPSSQKKRSPSSQKRSSRRPSRLTRTRSHNRRRKHRS